MQKKYAGEICIYGDRAKKIYALRCDGVPSGNLSTRQRNAGRIASAGVRCARNKSRFAGTSKTTSGTIRKFYDCRNSARRAAPRAGFSSAVAVSVGGGKKKNKINHRG